MKAGVYGNCQANGVADSIKSFLGDVDVHVYRVNEALKASEEDLRANALEFSKCDIIFYQPTLNRHHEPFSPQGFASMCDRLAPYPHIAFRGMQPDCCHINTNGQAIQSAMGPYHSALIAAAFLEGISEERTEALFNAYVYARLSYVNRSRKNEVIVRDCETLGFDLRDFIAGERGRFMNTINHPAINVIYESTRQALIKAGISPNHNGAVPADRLAQSFVWPVYPEIGRAFGISEAMQFFARKKLMGLSELIAENFRIYAPRGEALSSPEITAARAFLAHEVRAS